MRLSEIYTSIQGEGPNVGKPTTFIRFGGCNLRCKGWGEGVLPDGTIVSGCDTVFAVYPEWRSHWEHVLPEEIVERVPHSVKNVCITGGEPLTQRSRDLDDLVGQLRNRSGHTIDLFTNGTRLLPSWAKLHFTTVIMDYKLPGSGEYGSFLEANWQDLNRKDAVKFVCKDRHDFNTALDVLSVVPMKAQIYFGVVWDKLHPTDLAAWVEAEYPDGKINLQTHKYIWPADARRV